MERRMAVLWLRFLKEVEENLTDVSSDLKENADICRALELCEEGAYTEAELYAYDEYWDIIRTENGLIAEGEAKGEAKGRIEGRAEGEAKGRAEGIVEGETKSLISIVLNCRRNGFSMEQIQAITGLSGEKIQEIFDSNAGG
jgi:flagellar biosynthesis/type III secretory pathway protein FliH